jgi:hypothetical protein
MLLGQGWTLDEGGGWTWMVALLQLHHQFMQLYSVQCRQRVLRLPSEA